MAESRRKTAEKLLTDQDILEQQAILEEINTIAAAEIKAKKEEKLGKGGFNVVYKAGPHHAISESIAEPRRHKKLNFFQERASTLLREANIRSSFLQIYNYMDQKLTKIMPLGVKDLFTFIKEEKELKPELSAKLIAQIALGIYALHNNNIVHGDLKLENILVMLDGIIQIIDLNGVAKVRNDGIRIDPAMETLGSYIPYKLSKGLKYFTSREDYDTLEAKLQKVDAKAIDIYAFSIMIEYILNATEKPLPSKFDGLIKLSKSAKEYDPKNKIKINMILNSDLWGKNPEDRQRYFDDLTAEAVASIDKTKSQHWSEHAPAAGQALNLMPAPIQDIYILHERILKQSQNFDPKPQAIAELCVIKQNINQIITQLPDVLRKVDYEQYNLPLTKIVVFTKNFEKKLNNFLTQCVWEEYTVFKKELSLEKRLQVAAVDKTEDFPILITMQKQVQSIVALVDKEDKKNQAILMKLQTQLVNDLIQHEGYTQNILNEANLVLRSTNAAIEKGGSVLGISEQCERYSTLCQLIHENLPEGDDFKKAQVFFDIAEKLNAISKLAAKESNVSEASIPLKDEKNSLAPSASPKPEEKKSNSKSSTVLGSEKKPSSPDAESGASKKSLFVASPAKNQPVVITSNQPVVITPRKKSPS